MNTNRKKSAFSHIIDFISRLLPGLFWILLIFGFEDPSMAWITIISALIHECGHIAYLIYIKKDFTSIRAVSSGFRIRSTGSLSYRDERNLYLCGPFANLLVAFICLLGIRLFGHSISTFISINVATAISNLLPIEGYDGYGALRAVICERDLSHTYLRGLYIISCALIFTFCIISLYMIDRFGGGYWIFAIFFVSMIKQIDKSNYK